MPILTQQYLTVVYILYVLGWEMGGQCPPNCEVRGGGKCPPCPPPSSAAYAMTAASWK